MNRVQRKIFGKTGCRGKCGRIGCKEKYLGE
jgi:hypothetical protein